MGSIPVTLTTPVRTALKTGGTTEEMMQSSTSSTGTRNRSSIFLISTPYWSEVLIRSVAIRASKWIFSSSIPPITMLLFPMSMARSILFTSNFISLSLIYPLPDSCPGTDLRLRRTALPGQAALGRSSGQPEQGLSHRSDQHRGCNGLRDAGGGDCGHHQAKHRIQRHIFYLSILLSPVRNRCCP